jgi:inner membrane protein
MGYLVYSSLHPWGVYNLRATCLFLFAANAADLDFIPGLLVGNPNRYHHGISHSIGLAVLFALVAGYFLRLRNSFKYSFIAFFILYLSHIVLDYFSIDTGAPYGEPLLWPLVNDYYISPVAFLPDIQRAAAGKEFILSLFSPHNFWAVTVECLILLPFILLIQAINSLKSKRET